MVKNPIFQNSLESYRDKRLTERHAIVYGATEFLMTRVLGGDGLVHDTVLEVPKRFRYPHKAIPPDPELGKSFTELLVICPECLNAYPRSTEYWHVNEDGRDGLYSKCIECKRKADREQKRKKRANKKHIR